MVLVVEDLPGVLNGADHVDHVNRESDRPSVVPQAPGDRLADPPGGIGGELETLAPVELFHSSDQAQVSFLDEVEEIEAASGVALGDRDDQAQIGADEGHLRLFAFGDETHQLRPLGDGEITCFQAGFRLLAALHGAGQIDLVFGRQQKVGGNFVEIETDGVTRA